MYRYSMKYFNPNNGKLYTNIDKNIVEANNKDQFQDFRNPNTKYVVGVVTWMTYIDWKRPSRYLRDSESNDKTDTQKMYYDLELDKDYNIIGGQWRAKKVGRDTKGDNLNHKQPDFFWAITKDWKPFFGKVDNVAKWEDTSKAPPASWKKLAKEAHEFIYHKKYEYGTGQKCTVYHKTQRGKKREVSCEYEEPQPQPFINVVNILIELAK